MITLPSFIPINIDKFKTFIARKYKIDIHIDGEFIEESLHDEYNYHIYKKGKKKNSLKIYKNRKNQKNRNKNISLKELKFNNNNDENIIENEKTDNYIKYNEIKGIKDKTNKIDINNNKEYLDKNNKKTQYNHDEEISNIYNEYKYIISQFNYVNSNYEYLKNLYNYLIEKHKNTYNFFISLIMGIQKIHKEIKSFRLDNKIIKIKEIEHKKILYNIEKIIPSKELILNLNF